MTEQVQRPGDRPTELNDSIAFSRYTQAIEQISI
jgi:hypothetical protein